MRIGELYIGWRRISYMTDLAASYNPVTMTIPGNINYQQVGLQLIDTSTVSVVSSEVSDDDLLIAVAVNANSQAFNILFQRFARRIQAMGVKLTKNEQLAKDLVQESMLAVWRKAPQFDSDRGSARAWIFTLVRNRCFDMLRQQNRQPGAINADDIWETEPSADHLPDQQAKFYDSLEFEQFQKHCLKLPLAQQQVIEQIYVNGLTQDETAKLLQIPQGTVKSRLRLGMEKLRQLIGID